jgi:hypothetical protein
VDVLRRPEVRATLLEALEGVDRLVLLGDVLELRHGPRRDALAGARSFFEDLGLAFAEREVVVLAGNHDHALVEPWLARRGELPGAQSLGVEQRFAAEESSPMLATLAQWAAPARVTGAYPGIWLRPDVYATHGHYLDCHLTIPTMERLGIGAMARILRRPPASFATPEDYEAVTGPVFAWVDAVARQARTSGALNGASTVRAWRALGGDGRSASTVRTRALAGAFPLAVGALNRAGLGPLRPDISSPELRRAGLRAMGEVATRLGLDGPPRPDATHTTAGGNGPHAGAAQTTVIFGHTHRAGPLPGDAPHEWLAPGGARLMNAGCWTYDGYFLTATPGESPYWPGGCVVVDDEGPPILRRLLESREHAELAPTKA